MKLVSLFLAILTAATLGGCGGNNPAPEATTVFSTLNAPVTQTEVQNWLNSLSVQASAASSGILTSPALTWESHILPLSDCLLTLTDSEIYNSQLMTRSHDPAVRNLAGSWYQQIPAISDNIRENAALKTKVVQSLETMVSSNPKEKEAKNYLLNFFNTKYSDSQLNAISVANQHLTTISLIYYHNSITKSAFSTFSAADFACLPSNIKSQISTDSAGNYVFDANDNSSLNFTLAKSCLSENTRERLSAVSNSKAASENAPLWPEIAKRRVTYAQAFGFENFALQRLSDNMIQTTTAVYSLLDNLKSITQPAFERLTQRYKAAQSSEQGILPTTVYNWNRDRYYSTVCSQVLSDPPSDPKFLTFPETFESMLLHFGRIAGLKFIKSSVPKTWWNSNVIEYTVYERKTMFPAGTLLVDPYQISGLSDAASAGYLKIPRIQESGKIETPIVKLDANLSKSSSGEVVLSFREYTSFAHELGHVVHFLLKPYNSSTKSLEDFIEIPSITFEHIAKTPTFLKAVLSTDPYSPLKSLPADFLDYFQYYLLNPVLICEDQRIGLSFSATAISASSWTSGVPADLGKVFQQSQKDYYFAMSDLAEPGYSESYFIRPTTDASYYYYSLAYVIAADILSVFKDAPNFIFDDNIGQRYRYYILQQSSYGRLQALNSFLGRPWNYNAYKSWFETATSQL
jgi:Zn-dependent oligopeptidase